MDNKDPIVRITVEGVDGYVEIERWMLKIILFTAYDHRQYLSEYYTDGSKEALDDITNFINETLEYMYPEYGEDEE